MTRLAGVIGNPVAHSISPAFQQAAFDALGLDIRYERWRTAPEALPARIEALRDSGCLGANVTIPYKVDVIPHLDDVEPFARQVGAVNTIANESGRLLGTNTDGPGFLRALRAEAGCDPSGARVLLLGAGGAARGIAFALLEAAAAEIAITNRTHARAVALAADLGPRAAALTAGDPTAPYDVIVNTTSLGMAGATPGLPCRLDDASPSALVVDIVYNPEETAFLAHARELGLRTLSGLPMLVYQGALSFERWTGRDAPVEVMFAAARQALRSPAP